MHRVIFSGVVALLLVIGALAACGADVLPPDAIAADTAVVVHVDAAHFTPDGLAATGKALFGEDAKELEEPVKKFRELFSKATMDGVEGITMVAGGEKEERSNNRQNRDGNGILYISLKPDADVEAIKTMLTTKILERGDKNQFVFDQLDNWLAMHLKIQVFPVKPDADRQARFADALKSVSQASVQIAFIPDQPTRERMIKSAGDTPGGPKDAGKLIANCKWTALAINIDSAPSVALSADAANETDAKALVDNANADLADLKAKTQQPGPMMLVAPMVAKVIDGLKISQNGTHVSIMMETASIKLLTDFADRMGLFNQGN